MFLKICCGVYYLVIKRRVKELELNNEGIEDLELRMLESSGKNLINDIKKIDLNNWIKNDGGRRKNMIEVKM